MVHSVGSWGPRLSSCRHLRLWSDQGRYAQADLSLRWANMPFCWFCHVAEPEHSKTYKMTWFLGKTQISLCIHMVWSESLWVPVAKDTMLLMMSFCLPFLMTFCLPSITDVVVTCELLASTVYWIQCTVFILINVPSLKKHPSHFLWGKKQPNALQHGFKTLKFWYLCHNFVFRTSFLGLLNCIY